MSSDTLAVPAPPADPGQPVDATFPNVVRRRRPARRTAAVPALAAALALALALALFGPAVDSAVRDRFTSAATLRGLWPTTPWPAAGVMVFGFVLGTLLAAGRLSTGPVSGARWPTPRSGEGVIL